MDIHKQIDTVLAKKMDRQAFLKYSLGGLLAVSSIGTVVKLLQNNSHKPATSVGYSAGAYGGTADAK